MLVITKALRQHMVEKCGLAADANDDAVRKAVIDAQLEGKIDIATIKQLTVEPASQAVKALDDRVSGLEKKFDLGINEIKALITGQPAGGGSGSGAASSAAGGAAGAGANQDDDATKAASALSSAGGVAGTVNKAMAAGANLGSGTGAAAALGTVDLKSVVERYSDARTAATWDKAANASIAKQFAGVPVNRFQKGGVGSIVMDMATERSLAITGAWFKHLINKQCRAEGRQVPWQFKMSEHDKQLVTYAANECRMTGPIGYKGLQANGNIEDTDAAAHWCDAVRLRDLTNGDYWIKAVLDLDGDASGGLEAVPIEFDANFILTPLLTGELFPFVDVVNVSRRRMEGVKINNPTLSWGTDEGTAISLFDTDGFIEAFDNNIYPVTGALELGKDFQSDSPLSIGQIIVQQYGQQFKLEMDNVIANGNGTDRPEGLFVAAGVASVTPATPAGAPAVGDYEGLMFGVAKEFRQRAGMPPNSRAVFLGTDTAYSRARGIPVDSGADERRIFGIDEEMAYTLFRYRYAVNASAGNAVFGFFCLNDYRLYRRQGLEVSIVRDDRESVLANTDLIVVRARFGGALTHAGAGAKITNGQV